MTLQRLEEINFKNFKKFKWYTLKFLVHLKALLLIV